MLQQAIQHINETLCSLFKASLRLKYIPNSWRGVIVLFLPKPGKKDYSQVENYRPISLTSFILKTLEKLIDRYVRDVPLKIRKIHVKQHAYQTGKSTENALHNIISSIERSLVAKEFALGCFIDIAGAFNHITYRAIKRACYKFGIDPGIIGWIEAMLKSRIVSAYFGASVIHYSEGLSTRRGSTSPTMVSSYR